MIPNTSIYMDEYKGPVEMVSEGVSGRSYRLSHPNTTDPVLLGEWIVLKTNVLERRLYFTDTSAEQTLLLALGWIMVQLVGEVLTVEYAVDAILAVKENFGYITVTLVRDWYPKQIEGKEKTKIDPVPHIRLESSTEEPLKLMVHGVSTHTVPKYTTPFAVARWLSKYAGPDTLFDTPGPSFPFVSTVVSTTRFLVWDKWNLGGGPPGTRV